MALHIVEKLLEQSAEHSTLVWKFWITFFFVLRFLMVVSIADTVFGDEQEQFVCNTMTPGCENVCFNDFSPISLICLWALQILCDALPTVIFIVYTDHKLTKVNQAKKLKKEEQHKRKKKIEQEKKKREEIRKRSEMKRKKRAKQGGPPGDSLLLSPGPTSAPAGTNPSNRPLVAPPPGHLEAEGLHVNTEIKLEQSQMKQRMQKKVKRIRRKCRTSGKSYNDGFRPRGPAQWRRVGEVTSLKRLSPGESLLLNAKLCDIKQSGLKNCWLLSDESLLPKFPYLLHLVVVTKEVNKEGVYSFLLCKWGRWHAVIIDDFLPCDEYGRLLYSATEHPWVALLEKAMAKLNVGYEELNSGIPLEGITTLTGFSCDSLFLAPSHVGSAFEDGDSNWLKFLGNTNAGRMVAASIPDCDEMAKVVIDMVGLVSEHSYSVLDARWVELSDGTPERLVKLRNPHGTRTWTGCWGRGCLKWKDNPELVKLLLDSDDDCLDDSEQMAVGPYGLENGTFWMNWSDFSKFFNWVFFSKHYNGYLRKVEIDERFSEPSAHPVRAHILRVQEETRVDFALWRQASRTLERHGEYVFDGYLCLFKSAGQTPDGKFILGSLVASALRKINSPMTCSCVLKPEEEYVMVCLSVQDSSEAAGTTESRESSSLSSGGNPSRYVLTMHSSQKLLSKTCQLTHGSLADAMIKLVMKEGKCELQLDGMLAFYWLTNCQTGSAVVVENRHPVREVQFVCDCSASDNLTSTRGALLTIDVIPPRCRQVVQVLTVIDSTSKLPSRLDRSWHFADVENSEIWLPPDVRHDPALTPEMEPLHLRGPI